MRGRLVKLGSDILDIATLRQCALGGVKISLSKEAVTNVEHARQVVDNIVRKGDVAYGINTGFGLFANVVVPPTQLAELQTNLIRSHAAGVGKPLSIEHTRMLLVLRINTLARGHSGIRLETLQKMIDAFNADAISVVPSQGTVGASGDLAPLSHVALGLLGEGDMWDGLKKEIRPAADVLRDRNLSPIRLEAKEGLALINGTQMMTAIGADAVHQARNAALCADIVCALSVEVLKGTPRAFHPSIHSVRPHRGQVEVARRLRNLLSPTSSLFESHKHMGRVQDAYSLRCAPQVHGIVHDTIDFVENILVTEMNSATDNPMIFSGSDDDMERWGLHEDVDITAINGAQRRPLDTHKVLGDTAYRAGGGFVISGGNFHGEYPAKALDYLAIAITEIANISERRIERLVNPALSELPAFLVEHGGLHSGFMIAHCTAAALTSENKVLCHPSSVDTISTSGSKEDHVSMGGFSARKAAQVVQNVDMVVAIELLAACQALEFFRPLQTTPQLERVHALVRKHVAPWDGDRYMTPDLNAAVELIRSGQLLQAVGDVIE
eukprot:m.80529 g.80529  ORF g.80529 m.80529 type:complete len:553 (+) comp9359_c1_seq2:365-2023(+)